MKNYYEILEVDKNASDEIIKVAYKSLVKKYHPDVQNGQAKIDAESKIKQINEAYDILSDPAKKEDYDQNLEINSVSIEEYNMLLDENLSLKKQLGYINNMYDHHSSANYSNSTRYASSKYSDYSNSNSNNNSKEDRANNNYTTKKNIFSNLSESFKNVIAFLLTFLIIFIIFKIPFVRTFFLDSLGNGSFLIISIVLIGYIYFRGKR